MISRLKYFAWRAMMALASFGPFNDGGAFILIMAALIFGLPMALVRASDILLATFGMLHGWKRHSGMMLIVGKGQHPHFPRNRMRMMKPAAKRKISVLA